MRDIQSWGQAVLMLQGLFKKRLMVPSEMLYIGRPYTLSGRPNAFDSTPKA